MFVIWIRSVVAEVGEVVCQVILWRWNEKDLLKNWISECNRKEKKKSRLSPRFGPFERECIVVPLTGEGRCLGRILERGKFVYFYCISEWRC